MSQLSSLVAGGDLRELGRRRETKLAVGLVVLILLVVWFQSGSLWPYVVGGVSDGAVYSLAALGLVLTYRTSGIFNFSIGAQAAASAYVFYSFRDQAGMSWPLAALLTLVTVGLIGSFILERLAFWLSEAPAVLRVVATIGLLVLLQSLLTGIYGVGTIQFAQYLPTGIVHIGGVAVMTSQIIIVILAIAATVGLYLFFARTRTGIAMQAVVDDAPLLALQATSPILIRRYAWAIGSCFVSISGMLVAPAIGIDVNQLLLVYIAAFGAAAIASFSNLGVAFGASIGIGVAMNIVSDKLATNSHLFVASLYTQLPFIALVLALALTPTRRLVERGARRVRKFTPVPSFPKAVVVPAWAIALAVTVILPFAVRTSDLPQYTTGIGFAVVLMALGLLLWTSGQISLCHMSFAAVGAVTMAHAQSAGVPWLIGLLFAALAALPVGALVAIPSFRLSGTYLAVITFGVGLLFQNLIFQTPLMFGNFGTQTVSRPHLLGLNTTSDRGYYFVCAVLAVLSALTVILVRRSRLGRLLRGLADSPPALEAHGTNTRYTRLFVFAISASIAAVGGAMIAGVTSSATSASSGPFGYFNSLVLVAVLTFCRRQPVISPIIAAVLFEVIKIYPPFNSTFFVNYQGVFFGALAIAVAVAPGIKNVTVSRRASQRRGFAVPGRTPRSTPSVRRQVVA